MDRLQRALEAAGVEFTNGDQPGVRLGNALPKARQRAKAARHSEIGPREVRQGGHVTKRQVRRGVSGNDQPK